MEVAINPMTISRTFIAVLCFGLLGLKTMSSEIVDYSGQQRTEWRLKSGHVIRFENVGAQTFIRDRDVAVLTLTYPEIVTGVVASPNEKALLISVGAVQSSVGRNYAYLLTAREGSDHALVLERWLPAGRDPMKKNRWIVELGAISDDAERVLIKMAEPSADAAPFVVGKIWETWNLKESKIVRVGLTVDR